MERRLVTGMGALGREWERGRGLTALRAEMRFGRKGVREEEKAGMEAAD